MINFPSIILGLLFRYNFCIRALIWLPIVVNLILYNIKISRKTEIRFTVVSRLNQLDFAMHLKKVQFLLLVHSTFKNPFEKGSFACEANFGLLAFLTVACGLLHLENSCLFIFFHGGFKRSRLQ